MELKDFAQYLRNKSLSQLLHRARKESLKRILAHEEILDAARKKPVQKRTGTRCNPKNLATAPYFAMQDLTPFPPSTIRRSCPQSSYRVQRCRPPASRLSV